MNLLAHLNDLSRKLVPYTKWLNTIAVTRRTQVVAVIHMQIRAADTAALDIQNDAIFGLQRWVRVRLIANVARTVKYESFHLFILTLYTLPPHSIRVFRLCRANTPGSSYQNPTSSPKWAEFWVVRLF